MKYSRNINGEKYHTFFGDIHGHSNLSPDVFFGSPNKYYEYARDVAKLDFAALTDHDCPRGLINPKKWKEVQQVAKKYNSPGKFVTFIGYEWSSGSGLTHFLESLYLRIAKKFPGNLEKILKHKFQLKDKKTYGHKNVYFKDEKVPKYIFSCNSPYSNDPEKLWKALEPYDAITIPHHPLGGPCKPTDWSFINNKMQPFVEIFSYHGNSESNDCDYIIYNPFTKGKHSVQDALNMGHKLGIVCGTDTHTGKAGYLGKEKLISLLRWFYKGKNKKKGCIGVYAKELTRDAIWDSFLKRRVFGTTGNKSAIDFSSEGHFMGSEFNTNTYPKFKVKIIGETKILKIEIIKNGKIILRKLFDSKNVDFDFTDSKIDKGTNYYYVRAKHTDGNLIWSSPIWVAY